MTDVKFRLYDPTVTHYGPVRVHELKCDAFGDLDIILGWCNTTRELVIVRLTSHTYLHQFSGYKDRNGNELFDGDIVTTDQLEDLPDCDSWTREETGYAVVSVTPEYGTQMIGVSDWTLWTFTDEELRVHLKHMYVVGNIHQNKELLK